MPGEAILLRFAGVNIVPIHIVIASPFQDRPTGELRPIVTDNANRLSVDVNKRIKLLA